MATTTTVDARDRHRASNVFATGRGNAPARRICPPGKKQPNASTSATATARPQARQESTNTHSTQDSLFDGSLPSSWAPTQDTQIVGREEYEEDQRLRDEQSKGQKEKHAAPEPSSFLTQQEGRPSVISPAQEPSLADILQSSTQSYLDQALRNNEVRDLGHLDYRESQRSDTPDEIPHVARQRTVSGTENLSRVKDLYNVTPIPVEQRPRSQHLLRSDLAPPQSSSQEYLERAFRINEMRDLGDPDYQETQREDASVTPPRQYITRSRTSGLGVEDMSLEDDPIEYEEITIPDSLPITSRSTTTSPNKRRSPDLPSSHTTKRSRPSAPVAKPEERKNRSFAIRFANLKGAPQRQKRLSLVQQITALWSSPITDILPLEIFPRGHNEKQKDEPLSDPRDWSTPLLEACLRLAELSRTEPSKVGEIVLQAVEKQVSEKGGMRFVMLPQDFEVAAQMFRENLGASGQRVHLPSSVNDNRTNDEIIGFGMEVVGDKEYDASTDSGEGEDIQESSPFVPPHVSQAVMMPPTPGQTTTAYEIPIAGPSRRSSTTLPVRSQNSQPIPSQPSILPPLSNDQLLKELQTAREVAKKATEAAERAEKAARLAQKAAREAIERRDGIWAEMEKRFACNSPNRRT